MKLQFSLLLTLLPGTLFKFAAAEGVCNSSVPAQYIYDENGTQPYDASVGASNGSYNFCLPPDIYSSFETESQSDTVAWFVLGFALYKSWDNFLKWEGIVSSCSHFKGGWKEGASCVTDAIATFVTYAGTAYKIGRNIQIIHAWMNRNGIHFTSRDFDDSYAIQDVHNEMKEIYRAAGLSLLGVSNVIYDHDEHLITHYSDDLAEKVHASHLKKRSDDSYMVKGNSVVVHLQTDSGLVHNKLITVYDTHVYVNWLGGDGIEETNMRKRSDGRYKNERFSKGGIEGNICRSDLDTDRTNTDGDYVTWRIDIACHKDLQKHSGAYMQGFDKRKKETLFSLSTAPYLPNKKGILGHMVKCPAGLTNRCGRT